MPDGTRGPSRADVKAIQASLDERRPSSRQRVMDQAFDRLIRDLHVLGGTPKASPNYRRLRQVVVQRKREYLDARASWIDALVNERATIHRIEVSEKLTSIFAELLTARRRDDPLTPIAAAVSNAIDWMNKNAR